MLLIVFVTFRTYTKTLRMHFHINRSLCFVFSSESNVDFWWLLLYFMLHRIWKLFIKLASTTQNNDECNFLKWHPGNQWPSWRNSYFHFFLFSLFSWWWFDGWSETSNPTGGIHHSSQTIFLSAYLHSLSLSRYILNKYVCACFLFFFLVFTHILHGISNNGILIFIH